MVNFGYDLMEIGPEMSEKQMFYSGCPKMVLIGAVPTNI
jgi:hypothetical protein